MKAKPKSSRLKSSICHQHTVGNGRPRHTNARKTELLCLIVRKTKLAIYLKDTFFIFAQKVISVSWSDPMEKLRLGPKSLSAPHLATLAFKGQLIKINAPIISFAFINLIKTHNTSQITNENALKTQNSGNLFS
jgi:hypothetical protein